MFAKILGLGDLFAAIAVILLHYGIFSWQWALFFSFFLVLKGWFFRTSIMSVVDILCGFYLFVMVFGLSTVISWVVALYLFQKACFSLAAD